MKLSFGKNKKDNNADVLYLRDIRSYYRYSNELDEYKKKIDRSKEKEYIECYKVSGSQQCLYHIVMCNQDMVISFASQMCKDKYQMMDYIQEGNIGLLKALQKYNINYGVKFYTYAAIYVKAEMLRYEEKDDIYSPMSYIKFKKAIKQLTDYLNTFKSVYELPSYKEIKMKVKIYSQIIDKCIPIINDIVLYSLTENEIHFNPNYIMERVFPKKAEYIRLNNLSYYNEDKHRYNKFEYKISVDNNTTDPHIDKCNELASVLKKAIHESIKSELINRKITIQEYERVNRNLDGFFDCICNEENKKHIDNYDKSVYVLKYINSKPLLRSKIYRFLKSNQ